MKDYVLCKDCEGRFNQHGEKRVLARLPRDYAQPCRLQDDVIRETPFYSSPGLDLYEGARINALNMDQLVYFAASIFWRGAVHRWFIDGQWAPEVNLGECEEPLRLFLLGERTFPEDMWVTTVIWPFKPVLNVAIAPMQLPDAQPDGKRYWFYISGLGFVLSFGNAVASNIKHLCSQNTPERVVTVDRAFGERVSEFVRTTVRAGLTDEGREMLKEIEKIRNTDPRS